MRRPARRGAALWAAALLLLLASCGDDDTPNAPKSSGTSATTLNTTRATAADGSVVDLHQFVGLSLEQADARAQRYGLQSRVVAIDGRELEVTADYTDRRVNFSLEEGRVVAVEVG